MAYILGFFAADGYITVNKRGGQFWCIQITDKKLLENIKRAVQAEHKISIRPRKNLKEQTLYRLQIGSIEMCDDLRKIGFYERKTKSLAVPNVPKKCFPDFARGYFDGDGNVWTGYVHKKRKTKTSVLFVAFTSCSYEFLRELHTRLNLFGINGGCIYKPKNKQFCRLQFSTTDSLKLYDFMYNGCIKDSNFLLRKRRIFEKFKSLRL